MIQRLGQVTDDTKAKNPVPGASVYVYTIDGTDATLTSDGTTPLSQPLIADQFGNYSYYADVGYYREDTWFAGKLRFRENNIALGSPGADLNLRTDLSATSGSTLVGFGSRTLASKLGDSYHAKDAGLVGDGSDETTKLTAFFNHAIANPGVPHILEAKTYGFSSALPTISASDVWIEGYGAERHDVGALVTGTVLKWLGGAAHTTTGVAIEPVSGGSNQCLAGIFFRYIGIDCNSGNLGTALSVKSTRESDIDVVAVNAFAQGVYLGVVASLGEARDVSRNRIRVNSRQIEATTGYALVLDGDSTANVSMNEIEVDAQISNTPAIHCINSDTNYWGYVRITKNGPGTATIGMELLGGATAQTCSRNENIEVFSGNMPLKADGTDAYTVASTKNVIQKLDLDNNTPVPLLGTGATVAVLNAFQNYTPTVAASTGSITTSSATGEYLRRDGGQVIFTANATITTNGTGATALRVGLPFTAANDGFTWAVSVIEVNGTGKTYFGQLQPNTNYVTILDAGAYPGASGRVFAVSGAYRAVA